MLLVEDDTAMRQMLESMFTAEGFAVSEAASAHDAIGLARDHDFDVVLSDIKMPGKSGIELVRELREMRPATPVVLMTAFGTPETEVDALNAGAFDYTPKPFEPEAVLSMVKRAVDRHLVEVRARERGTTRSEVEIELIAESAAMRDVALIVRRAARTDTNVLILGESGTGKEVVARTLHGKSARGLRPFQRIHCGGDPEHVEAALFGTGAGDDLDRGLFVRADGGTLYLDAVEQLAPELQRKLVRVLQEHEVCPNGESEPVKVDVRVIAATQSDLDIEMESGRFREDLYYRLNVIPIRLRPLRERPEDIAALVEVFARKRGAGAERRFSQAAMRRLQAYPWRGNARELENVVDRAITLIDSEVIHADDLPLDASIDAQVVESSLGLGLAEAARAGFSLRDIEDRYIVQMLTHTGGKKGEAATRLGIDRKTLYRRDLSN
jgi:two-component system response regulator HydG